MSRVFTAAYSGSFCGLCDHMIHEGDEVTYVEDELCHVDCADDFLEYDDDDDE